MKRFFSLFILILATMTFSSCENQRSVTRQTFAFDTVVNITVSEKDSHEIDAAFKLCRNYEKIFSRTNPESELFAINEKGETNFSEDIKTVLDFSLKMSSLSNGAFDITVAPLVDLWNVSERTAPPKDSEIKDALENAGGNSQERKLDMGAVAKGYIADKIAEEFRKSGVETAIIDLGGNVMLLGKHTVGIRNPFSPDEILATIELKDKSAVTSGAYQRYFEYEGKRYHHIIDPRTGYPSDSGIASVTVISPSSMVADALSTSIFILGKDSLSLCDEFSDTDALIIMENGDIITTENFEEKYELKK